MRAADPGTRSIAAAELVEGFEFNGETIALGHWDTDGRSDPFNLIPTKQLAAAGITTIYTGHVHLPQRFVRDGVTVHVVGSLVPLAHGGDPGADLYVTASLGEVLADPGAYREKCLRVVLQPGEALDRPIDCLQLVVQRAEEQAEAPSVEFASFDLVALFEQAFEDERVSLGIRERILARYQAESVRR
jgi:hypothetical protein